MFGYVEVRVDLLCYLPGDGVFDVEEAGEFAGVGEGGGEAELVDLEDLGLDGDAVVVDGVAAYDDVVGVEGLGDLNGGGASGLEVDGQAEVVEGVLTVVAGDGEEVGGGEALIEGCRGKESPIQLRGAWPERLSKGRTRTTRPPVSGVAWGWA